MKKAAPFLLCASLLVALLAGCSQLSTKEVDSTVIFAEKGLALIQLMDEMAQSEEYRQLISTSEALNSLLSQIGNADYNSPRAIYRAVLPQNVGNAYLAELQLPDLPESIRGEVNKRLCGSFPTSLTSRFGVETLAAVSCLTTEESFLCEGTPENAIYFYLYDNEFSSAVVFQRLQDNIVTAKAFLIPSKVFEETASLETVSGLFAEMLFIQDVTVTEISLS